MKSDSVGKEVLIQREPIFSKATPNDIPAIVGFYNRLNDLNRTVEDWLWEYGRPGELEGIYTLVKIDDDILGTQAAIPIDLVMEGEKIRSGKSESSLLDPRLRGKGLFDKLYAYNLTQCTDEGIQVIWGMTSAVRKWREGLGFDVFEDMIVEASLILRPWHMVINRIFSSEHIGSGLYHSYKGMTSYLKQSRKRMKRNAPNSGSDRIEGHLISDDDINNLLGELASRKECSVSIDMSREYLNWRVWSNPNLRYQGHFNYHGDKLVSYCLASRGKNGELYIADMMALDDDSGAYLLDHLLDVWKKEKITVIKFMGNFGNPAVLRIFNILKDRGFLIEKTKMAFVIKCIGIMRAPNFKEWLVNGLWTEGFKI